MEKEGAQGIVHLVGDTGGQLAHAGQLARSLQGLLGVLERAVGFFELLIGGAQLLDGVGKAHLRAGQPGVEGVSMIEAGVVAAGAAVEQVLGLELAHPVQDLLELLGGGRVTEGLMVGVVGPGKVEGPVALPGAP